ncbi:FAD-linked oxidase C-terminal domain-containing protein [Sinomonas soli]
MLSFERMDRIIEVNADDQVAVVEPGVITASLDEAAAAQGLMYAPDPASYRTSTIGGNIATNAGGLRCAKYGVTRDSVLGLEVVLADGTLLSVGRRTIKGVAGYDLTGLFVGSEGTLGIVVGATLRLRPRPLEHRTVTAFFPDLASAFEGVCALGRARVQPAIVELIDHASLSMLDDDFGSTLAREGGALLLIQTDGHGAEAEAQAAALALDAIGADVDPPTRPSGDDLVELRRHTRGADRSTEQSVGADMAVPRSQLVEYAKALEGIAARHGIAVRVVAHAGDGNLHPTFVAHRGNGQAPPVRRAAGARLEAALDDAVRTALQFGGTITGEHGIGLRKLRWLPWEQRQEVIHLQKRIRGLLDPHGILNPGKALPEVLDDPEASLRAAPVRRSSTPRTAPAKGSAR